MSVTKTEIGSGFTARDEVHVNVEGGVGPEELGALRELFEGVGMDVRAEIRAFCEQVAGHRRKKLLEAAKRLATAETDEEREQARAERNAIPESEVDSEQWFAETILRYLGHADDQRVQGRHEDAARWDFQAGLVFGVAGMKFVWEGLALCGKDVVVGGEEGHAIAYGTDEEKQARWDRFQTTVNGVRREAPEISSKKIYEIAAQRLKKMGEKFCSAGTLKRHCPDPGCPHPRKN